VARCSGSRASSVDTLTTNGAAKKLIFGQSPIVTIIGKALWDVGHAPKDQSNRRKYMPDHAVWEIHPVMKLTVQ
jgi:hypothetical protein